MILIGLELSSRNSNQSWTYILPLILDIASMFSWERELISTYFDPIAIITEILSFADYIITENILWENTGKDSKIKLELAIVILFVCVSVHISLYL